ncbi:polysaccharide deacetylase [Paenibacillus sp. XY044]|nr:polysaccharide deacetylase [Paenibacillus sp. XY044]
MKWEGLFDRITRLRSKRVLSYGICKLVIRPFHGKSIRSDSGQWLHAGDWIGELHLDNGQVLELSRSLGPDRAALKTARLLKQSLRQIREAMDDVPELAEVKALTGITLLHRGLTHGLGFEQHPLESGWFRLLTTLYLRFLLRMLHPAGQKRVKHSAPKLFPQMLLMTRQAFIERYRCEANLRNIG